MINSNAAENPVSNITDSAGTDKNLDAKENALRQNIRQMDSAALAFSGGVDSALIAYIATQELGSKFTAITLRSALMKDSDVEECVQFCKTYEIQHVFLDMDILNNVNFTANCKDRCYYCKLAIFSAVQDYAEQHNFKHIMDGSNSEDCPDRRPGMRVLREQGIRSPLRECDFCKADIRNLSKKLNLFTWDKVSDSCLATGIPQGQRITLDTLRLIDADPSCALF